MGDTSIGKGRLEQSHKDQKEQEVFWCVWWKDFVLKPHMGST